MLLLGNVYLPHPHQRASKEARLTCFSVVIDDLLWFLAF